jgi:HK97 family phage portal protein
MSLARKLFRSDPFNNPAVPLTAQNVEYYLTMMGGGRTDANELVTPMTALQLGAVNTCVRLISDQVSVNPLLVYRLTDNGKEVATDHALYNMVHTQPNPEQNAVSFRNAVQVATLLWGNGYVEIQRDNANRPVNLWPRHPSRTRPMRNLAGDLVYETTDNMSHTRRIIEAADMIHIMGMTLDGMVGLSPIEHARQTIGIGLALDKFSARFFANYATPAVALKTDSVMQPEDKSRLRSDWESLQSGANQHRVAILDQGLDIETLSITMNDAQFLQIAQANDRKIAAMFAIPPYLIGDLEKSIKSNVEQQSIDLLNFCLKPWFSRWEMEFTAKLFSSIGRSAGRYVVKFDTGDLVRPDSASRTAFYATGFQNGYLSVNQILEMEGMNPIGKEGDEHFVSLALQSLGLAAQADPQPTSPDILTLAEEEEKSAPMPMRVTAAFTDLYRDGISRLLNYGERDSETIRKCLFPTLMAISQVLRAQHTLAVPALTPTDESFKAIVYHLKGIGERCASWKQEDIPAIALTETKRAFKALVFAAHRDAADAKARLQLLEEESA